VDDNGNDDVEMEVDIAYGAEDGEQHPAAKLVMDAAEVAIRELEAERDEWKELALRLQKRLDDLEA
jgi:hypothetical protein